MHTHKCSLLVFFNFLMFGSHTKYCPVCRIISTNIKYLLFSIYLVTNLHKANSPCRPTNPYLRGSQAWWKDGYEYITAEKVTFILIIFIKSYFQSIFIIKGNYIKWCIWSVHSLIFYSIIYHNLWLSVIIYSIYILLICWRYYFESK